MNPVRNLRWLGLLEGLSFLALLFVAMPLKYFFQQPLAVTVVGGVHGFLFLGFVAALFSASVEREWGLARAGRLFLASLVPFGFLWIDRELRGEG